LVSTDSLKASFAKYAGFGKKFDRAVEAVRARGVKEHRFLPSGRSIFTVVGNFGDEFIDPAKPYCSCSNFFFKVAGREEDYCYHLLAHKIASEASMIDTVDFADEEYAQLVAGIAGGVFQVLESDSA
jgi:predicted nucleic acid-binding Zn finger protein